MRLAIACSVQFAGTTADIDIFYSIKDVHLLMLKKSEVEADILDFDALPDKNPESWAYNFDKGYQGVVDSVRGNCPYEKRPGRYLTLEEEAGNREHASDRIIVENYFGCLCSLWNVLSSQFRCGEKMYQIIFSFLLGVTNMHVRWHSLPGADLNLYRHVKIEDTRLETTWLRSAGG